MYKYIAWRDGELLGERLVVLGPRRSASMPSISKRAFSPRAFEVESVADGLARCGGVPAKRFRGVKKLSFCANQLYPAISNSKTKTAGAGRNRHPGTLILKTNTQHVVASRKAVAF